MNRNPETALKWNAIVFAVLWTGWMLWWSGSLDRANVAIVSVCEIAVGYFWHRLMRWQFRRTRMLPPAGPDSGH
jgi:hypothetical protein